MIVVTIKFVLKVLFPPFTLIVADPIISLTFIEEMANEPASAVNNEVAISGSFGS